jgi:hypothetical protein
MSLEATRTCDVGMTLTSAQDNFIFRNVSVYTRTFKHTDTTSFSSVTQLLNHAMKKYPLLLDRKPDGPQRQSTKSDMEIYRKN